MFLLLETSHTHEDADWIHNKYLVQPMEERSTEPNCKWYLAGHSSMTTIVGVCWHDWERGGCTSALNFSVWFFQQKQASNTFMFISFSDKRIQLTCPGCGSCVHCSALVLLDLQKWQCYHSFFHYKALLATVLIQAHYSQGSVGQKKQNSPWPFPHSYNHGKVRETFHKKLSLHGFL